MIQSIGAVLTHSRTGYLRNKPSESIEQLLQEKRRGSDNIAQALLHLAEQLIEDANYKTA